MTARSASARKRRTIAAIAATLFAVFVTLGIVIGSALAPQDSGDAFVIPANAPPLPAVEPVALIALPPDAARVANAEQPFVGGDFPAARPFVFAGDATARSRAVDCLAAAVLYEAGDDGVGQRAVAQVVLNRARHPAFPQSVCGVVFQGSERRTGCQFTFTCDGALNRRWSDAAWVRARGVAQDALGGAVYTPVGLSTHYHTDWVRPYWSPTLDKLAQVGTHLFFRWPGFWGTPGAFRRSLSGAEPAIAKLATLSPAHAAGLTPEQLAAASAMVAPVVVTEAEVTRAVSAVIPRAARQLGDTIILTFERGQTPESFPALAEAACGARAYCKVMGWSNPQLAPTAESQLPGGEAAAGISDITRASMSFSYLRDQDRNLERALWNCDEFAREQRSQCMRGR